MFSFDKKDLQRLAVSTVGALTVSAACVMAAVGPAHAGAPAPLTVADWQTNVERQIDRRMKQADAVLPAFSAGEAIVAVHFTADGDYAGATLTHSSGEGIYDKHAMTVAKKIAYPVLPAGYRGQAQDVEMHLSYGDAPAKKLGDRPAQLAFHAVDGVQVASK